MSRSIDFARAPAMEIAKGNCAAIHSVKPENIFTFPEGILGFEHIKEYVILINKKLEPFMFLHAMDGSNLSFVCVETFKIKPDFNITIPKKGVEMLRAESQDDVLLLSLVTVRKEAEETTANLLSPLAVNMKTSLCMQIIPEKSVYPVKYKIWETLEKAMSLCEQAG